MLEGVQSGRGRQHPASEYTNLGAIGQNVVDLKEDIGLGRFFGRAGITSPGSYPEGSERNPLADRQLQFGYTRGDLVKRAHHRYLPVAGFLPRGGGKQYRQNQ